MGPLIPQNIISGDLNFFFAFLIGLAFGFILEQAGFSSSRKLAGVFYGYDFVVLKVFFTAGVTAATGIFFFQYLGWIDMDLVFVNPLFFRSAILGGVIMGFGFILGGFCPGTSFAAAVIGKIDAMVFILGIFAGIFLFGLTFDHLEPIYQHNPQGRIFIYHSLGLSQSSFLFLLIIVALAAFVVTTQLENKSSRFKELLYTQKLNVKYPVMLLLILGITGLLMPEKRINFPGETSKEQLNSEISTRSNRISAQKVTHFLINDTKELHLVDVRSPEEYQRFHLPGAVNLPLEEVFNKAYRPLLTRNNRKTVLYSNGGVKASTAWFFARRNGINNLYILNGGLNHLFTMLFEDHPNKVTENLREDNLRFIQYARDHFREGEVYRLKDDDARVPEVDEIQFTPAEGGC